MAERAPRGDRYDAVVVGASLAGCAAARLLALAGARVALVERRPDPAAHKVVCTHQIQPSANGVIERLGLAPLLAAAGAARARPSLWTPFGGWLSFPLDAPRSHGITRRRLDPILRELAMRTAGVDALLGHAAVGLVEDGNGVGGVEVENPKRERRTLRAALTVAADGRDSQIARLARVPARVLPNNRFGYFAYWRDVDTPPGEARVWFLEPDAAAVFPNEDGLTVIVAVPHRRRLAEFRGDPETAYRNLVSTLPDGPRLEGAERISKLVGKLDVPNKLRLASRPGLAFVGDAALAADPLFGVGCGWALQSAEWLADAVAPAIAGGETDLERALRRYRRTFRRRLLPHHLQISDFATGRPFRANERVAFRAAARDPAVGAAFESFATRRSIVPLLDPRLVPRAIRAGVR